MSNIQNAVHGAIARSISRNEIVTIRIGSEEDMQSVYDELVGADNVADYDHTDVTATLREVWGTDTDGDEWRVHIMQDERAGTARYHE